MNSIREAERRLTVISMINTNWSAYERSISPSIIAGGITTFTVTANGAKANMQQTVEYGLPANWNTNLVVASCFVSADNTVTFAIFNPTGGAIDFGSATYSVRVRP